MLIFLFLLSALVFANAKDISCVTPNGESAKCVPLKSCGVLKRAVLELDENAFVFAKQSQCSPESTTAMVCCGSAAKFKIQEPNESVATKTTDDDFYENSGPAEHTLLPDKTLCGIQIRQNEQRLRVQAEIDEFPWSAALKYVKNDNKKESFECGGSLINPRYILTAARCLNIEGYTLKDVRLGEWNMSTTMDCGVDVDNIHICSDDVIDIPVVNQIIHPYYSKKNGNNDIALLRLQRDVKYNDFIRPICIASSFTPAPRHGTELLTAGWGVDNEGAETDVKSKIPVIMVGQVECSTTYPNMTLLHANQACIIGKLNKNICNTDSGDPIMTTFPKNDDTEEEQWYQEGIIYQSGNCGKKGVPSRYTRVPRYTSWIVANLK